MMRLAETLPAGNASGSIRSVNSVKISVFHFHHFHQFNRFEGKTISKSLFLSWHRHSQFCFRYCQCLRYKREWGDCIWQQITGLDNHDADDNLTTFPQIVVRADIKPLCLCQLPNQAGGSSNKVRLNFLYNSVSLNLWDKLLNLCLLLWTLHYFSLETGIWWLKSWFD